MYVNTGAVKMSGGAINTNTATTAGVGAGGASGGGGLFVNGGSVTLQGVDIDANRSAYNGGGVYVKLAGSLKLIDDFIGMGNKTISPKAGGAGGGIFMNGGTVTVSGGSIAANSASPLYTSGGGFGGGLFNNSGTLTLTSGVYFLSNTATNSGGGMFLANGSNTTFNGATVEYNQATTGPGVCEQSKANVSIERGGLTDYDDPGGNPYNTGIA